MPGSKGKRGRRPGKSAKPGVSSSARAGTIFPVSRCNRKLRQGRYSRRLGASAGAFMAAVLEYLTAETFELSGNVCHNQKKKQIKPKHINLAFRSDAELGQLMAYATLTQSTVPVHIHE